MTTNPRHPVALSRRSVRLAVFAVLIVIALGAIWLIDRRAMERMNQPSSVNQTPPTHTHRLD